MKAQALAMFAAVAVQGCSTLTESTFRVGEVDYDKFDNNPTINEMRIFTKNAKDCDSFDETDETPPVLLVAAGGVLIDAAFDYGKKRAEEYAKYVDSDLRITGSSIINSSKSNSWPSAELYKKYDDKLSATIEELEDSPKDRSYASMSKEEKAKYDEKRKVEFVNEFYAKERSLKPSENDLCVMIVAGKYSGSNVAADIANRDKPVDENSRKGIFSRKTKGAFTNINQYRMPVVGISETQYPSPFDGLIGDPSFLAEFRLTPVPGKEKTTYFLTPSYIFYPKPLHKEIDSGLERKLAVEFQFEENKVTWSRATMVSDHGYSKSHLQSDTKSFEADNNQPFTAITATVIEGPDGMPTGKIVTAISTEVDKQRQPLKDKLAGKEADESKK
ncbi:DUF3784 domain-containing protein [Pseudomonas cucumis]|uniref:DUF3784 domain-containing protein n=1 Tax=Pseudomonas cucumis TaxID=2954082 RepID=A0ABY9EQX9_9PSED|nr:DUF3784 domain-containing protein [Pseudomonas cucumis]WLG82749.1 DUF3784 domain-containing protein [Pseudomonas cucumis]